MLVYILFLAALWLIALAQPLGQRAKITWAALLSIFFIGFRFEVGFDWPSYKDEFERLATTGIGYIISHISAIQAVTQHEVGYIILSGIAAHILPQYELFQCLVFIAFYFSCYRLAKALNCFNPVAAFAMAQPFILISLEFSTLRQTLAITFFNLGLSYIYRRSRLTGYGFFLAAILMQLSALMYIGIYILSIGASKRATFAATLGVVVAIVVSSPTAMQAISELLPGFAAAKLSFYVEDRNYTGSFVEQAFSLVLYIYVAFSCWKMIHNTKINGARADNWALTFVMISALIASAFIWLPVFRNRLMYEFIIIFGILIYSDTKIRLSHARYVLFSLGAVIFTVYMTQRSSFVYIPYQNYIVSKITDAPSTGRSRQDEFYRMLRAQR